MSIDWQVKLEQAVLQGDHAGIAAALANGADPTLWVKTEATRSLLDPNVPHEACLLARVLVMRDLPDGYPDNPVPARVQSWGVVQSLLIDAVAPRCTDGLPLIMAQEFDLSPWGLRDKPGANTVLDLLEYAVFMFDSTPGALNAQESVRHLMQSLPVTPAVCRELEALVVRMLDRVRESYLASFLTPGFQIAVEALLVLPEFSEDLVKRLEDFEITAGRTSTLPLLHALTKTAPELRVIPGSDQLLKKLLDQGCHPNLRDRETGNTALMVAANYANPDAIATLLEAGADSGLKNFRGWNVQSYLGSRNIHPDAPMCRALIASIKARQAINKVLPGGSIEP